MTKRNVIIITLVALTVFNITALTTIIFTQFYSGREVNSQIKEEEEVNRVAESSGAIDLPQGRYAQWFRDQLQLDEDQFEIFRNANRKYHHEGAYIIDELSLTRKAIIQELGRPIPDEGELKFLSERIGELHVQLKELTINYYLTMKDACTEEQKAKLYEIFRAMVDSEGNATIPQGNFN